MNRYLSALMLLLVAAGCGADPTCGNSTEHASMQAMPAWPPECRDLKVHCDFRTLKGLPQAQFKSIAQQVCRNASSVSALRVSLTDDRDAAHIHFEGLKMATRGGPAGWCHYPRDCAYLVEGRFNTNTNWSAGSFMMAFGHELGHGVGLPHTDNTRDIMHQRLISDRPYIKGTYGPHFSGPELVKRYGARN